MCLVVDADTGESFTTSADKLQQAMTVYEHVEKHGKTATKLQVNTVWKREWRFNAAQVRALITLITEM